MQDMLYNMIFKRKSFHIFKDIGTISAAELCEIEEKYRSFFAACGRHKNSCQNCSLPKQQHADAVRNTVFFYIAKRRITICKT